MAFPPELVIGGIRFRQIAPQPTLPGPVPVPTPPVALPPGARPPEARPQPQPIPPPVEIRLPERLPELPPGIVRPPLKWLDVRLLKENMERLLEELARRDPTTAARLRSEVERAVGDIVKALPPDAVVEEVKKVGRVVSALARARLAISGDLRLAVASKDGSSVLMVYALDGSAIGVRVNIAADGSLSFKVLPDASSVVAELRSILSTYGTVA